MRYSLIILALAATPVPARAAGPCLDVAHFARIERQVVETGGQDAFVAVGDGTVIRGKVTPGPRPGTVSVGGEVVPIESVSSVSTTAPKEFSHELARGLAPASAPEVFRAGSAFSGHEVFVQRVNGTLERVKLAGADGAGERLFLADGRQISRSEIASIRLPQDFVDAQLAKAAGRDVRVVGLDVHGQPVDLVGKPELSPNGKVLFVKDRSGAVVGTVKVESVQQLAINQGVRVRAPVANAVEVRAAVKAAPLPIRSIEGVESVSTGLAPTNGKGLGAGLVRNSLDGLMEGNQDVFVFVKERGPGGKEAQKILRGRLGGNITKSADGLKVIDGQFFVHTADGVEVVDASAVLDIKTDRNMVSHQFGASQPLTSRAGEAIAPRRVHVEFGDGRPALDGVNLGTEGPDVRIQLPDGTIKKVQLDSVSNVTIK